MTETEGALVGILGGVSIAGILEYFCMSQEGVIIMTVMLILDFLMGLLSAKSRGEKIESNKRERGLIKKLVRRLLPFIFAGGLVRTGMPGIDGLVKIIVGMIVFSELYSIIGHIYSINYGEKLPECDAFKMLINSISKFIRELIKKEAEKIDSDEEEQE